jgi:hypothetical protein
VRFSALGTDFALLQSQTAMDKADSARIVYGARGGFGVYFFI